MLRLVEHSLVDRDDRAGASPALTLLSSVFVRGDGSAKRPGIDVSSEHRTNILYGFSAVLATSSPLLANP